MSFRDDELDVILGALCYYETMLEDWDDGSNDEWAMKARQEQAVRARVESAVRKMMTNNEGACDD